MAPLSLAEFLQASASAAAAGRLIQLRFGRRQRAILCYLIFLAVFLMALALINPASRVYFSVFLAGTVLSWIFEVFAVREMFALTFDRYRGIRTAGRWVLYVATGLAIAASVLITRAFGHPPGHGSIWLYYVQIVDRSLVLTLAVVISAIVLFLSRYPLNLSPNTYVSTGFFSAVFLSEAVTMVIDNLSTFLYVNWVDVTQVAFAAVCLIGWAVMLRPEGVNSGGARQIVFESPAENDLLKELESLNTLLGGAGRQ